MATLRDFLPPVKNAPPGAAGETAPVRVESTSIRAAAPDPRNGVSNTLALRTDATGRPDFSAVVRQGENASRTVHASRSALVEKPRNAVALARPSAEETAATVARTRAALAAVLAKRGSRGAAPGAAAGSATYMKYTAANAGAGGGGAQRVVKMVQAQVDPLEPPRFSQKKAAMNPPSPPVPVLHSPERRPSAAERAQWRIPPVVSNWKNPRGYTIQLDKRLAAQGAAADDRPTLSARLAHFADALYNAERTARADVEKRAEFQRSVALRKKEAKESQLRDLAARARQERSGLAPPAPRPDRPPPPLPTGPSDRSASPAPPAPPPRRPRASGASAFFDDDAAAAAADPPAAAARDDDAAARRDAVREERRVERERELRARDVRGGDASAPTLKRSKLTRDRDRDVSERVALGQAAAGGAAAGGGELMYDQRLFNEGERAAGGLGGGFGASDAYNVYEKPLFAEKPSSSFQYRPKDSQADAAAPRAKRAPAADDDRPRDRPVEFERDAAPAQPADPFGLDKFAAQAERGRAPRERKK